MEVYGDKSVKLLQRALKRLTDTASRFDRGSVNLGKWFKQLEIHPLGF